MAVQLTYTGTPFAEQIKQQGFKAGNPTGGFSTRLADLFQKGPKTFTTPNLGVASLYGKTIPVASSTANLRLPSGAIPGKTFLESLKNLGGTRFGTEVIQTPEQATKGMRIAQTAERLKNVSPTAAKLLSGQTVTGLGGAAGPGIIRSLFSLPFTGATIGPTILATLMGPSVARGDFKADEAFQVGGSEVGQGEFFKDQDFNQGYVSGALPAVVSGDPNQITGGITEALPPDAVLNETGVNQGGRGIIDLIRAGGTRLKDTFLQGAGASGGLNIGARLGMMVNPALAIPAALAGAFFGARGIREATPGEKGIQSLYGGQNTIGQGTTFIDPITGEEIESEMAGYNISSMFGKGLPSAIQSRIDRINRTLQKKQSDILEQRRDALEKEKAAAEAAELAAKQQAARTAIADAGSGFDDYDSGQAAGMGFGGGRTDPTDKS
jgi:hypothetical protein